MSYQLKKLSSPSCFIDNSKPLQYHLHILACIERPVAEMLCKDLYILFITLHQGAFAAHNY